MPTQHRSEFHLPLWSEAVGVYDGLHTDDSCLCVRVGDKALVFIKGSKEAEIAQNELKSDLIGKKIALLRSDDLTRPLLVRIIGE